MQVFFYGLFMDEDILSKNGVNPSNPRVGVLKDYTLKIGNRASLLPSKNDEAYGILVEVDDQEIIGLYAEKSVADYIPEDVTVTTNSGEEINATCYNLPLQMLSGTNEQYARSLHELAVKLEFPEDYLNKIKEFYT